jgi:putative addiction module killer protein
MHFVIQQTEDFADWRKGLKDLRAATAIRRRLERAQAGNLGDAKTVGEGVSEMRIDVGTGYRLYYTVRDRVIVFLLVGGVKATPATDIRKAQALAKEI